MPNACAQSFVTINNHKKNKCKWKRSMKIMSIYLYNEKAGICFWPATIEIGWIVQTEVSKLRWIPTWWELFIQNLYQWKCECEQKRVNRTPLTHSMCALWTNKQISSWILLFPICKFVYVFSAYAIIFSFRANLELFPFFFPLHIYLFRHPWPNHFFSTNRQIAT